MKVVLAHAYYQQRGGEDVAFESELSILKEHGVDVVPLTVNNADINPQGLLKQLSVAKNTVWSQSAYDQVASAIARIQPDLIHFHNTFPSWSPSF